MYPTVETPYGTVGMIICFDIDFPRRPGPPVAANGADDPRAEHRLESVADVRSASDGLSRHRNRVAMVKADVAWDSVIVAPNGRVITSTAVHAERGGAALLVTDAHGPARCAVHPARGAPFRWLEWIATLVMLRAMIVTKIRRPRGADAPT